MSLSNINMFVSSAYNFKILEGNTFPISFM